MKLYKCTLHQDAWVMQHTEVEAESAEEAARLVRKAWRTGEPELQFEEGDTVTFDEGECDADDCELDEENQ